MLKPKLSVQHPRPDVERVKVLTTKMLRDAERFTLPEGLSAAFAVLTYKMRQFAVDLPQALENVDRLAADLKEKLTLADEEHQRSRVAALMDRAKASNGRSQ